MNKILIFPFLDSMPSGHHQVADAITQYVSTRTADIECKKIDLMNEWSPVLETMVTKTYLWWIRHTPRSYAWCYRQFAYKSKKERSYKHYNVLFQNKMQKIISEEKPDLIICTHAFPSYFINQLKKSGKCAVPSLNIYTDFFINDVWGRDRIDYHFVPDHSVKANLVNKSLIPGKKILTTGIPLDERFSSFHRQKDKNQRFNIILSGGSAGLGSIMELLQESVEDERVTFHVLCGNNKSLFEKISRLNKSHIQPHPYISSKEKMNGLYSKADAIITKPGGVTVSEALKKRVPIFIHSALPGQEEINLQYLKEQGLVFMISDNAGLAQQVIKVLSDKAKMTEYRCAVQRYLQGLDFNDPEEMFHFLRSLLESEQRGMNQPV